MNEANAIITRNESNSSKDPTPLLQKLDGRIVIPIDQDPSPKDAWLEVRPLQLPRSQRFSLVYWKGGLLWSPQVNGSLIQSSPDEVSLTESLRELCLYRLCIADFKRFFLFSE